MFTGIVETKVSVVSNQVTPEGSHLVLTCPWETLTLGESIAVNGVCLTVVALGHEQMSFDLSPLTLASTTLATLKPHQSVNIERALVSQSRMGGHYVSGHVDKVYPISHLKRVGDYLEITLSAVAPTDHFYLLPKGSITVDGVSLTINDVTPQSITLLLVPHTQDVTTLGEAVINQLVNIEFDYLTKIIKKQLKLMSDHKLISNQSNYELPIEA